MDDFYVFEVIEDFTDDLVQFEDMNNKFTRGSKFIGYVIKNSRGEDMAIKSNLSEIVFIPLDKVKKVYKINFMDVK